MFAAANSMRLGRLLVGMGLITDEQLAEATSVANGRPLPHVLEELGISTEIAVAQAVAESMCLPFVDIAAYDSDPSVALLLKTELMERYAVLPLGIEDGELVLAMVDPANIFAIDDVRIVTGKEIRPVVATQSDLFGAIARFTASQTNVSDMVGDLEQQVGGGDEDEDEEGEESVVARLMNQIVTDAIRTGAGDIYIEPSDHDLRIRYRIDGVCQVVNTLPRKMHRQLLSRLKITSGMDIAERRIPQDGRFGVVLDGKSVDFRVAVLPVIAGEMAVLRLLRRDSIMMSLKDLGFLEHNLGLLLEALALPYGAILVTGPTGSGKSTTLYAAINETNDPKANLITVEDPVEYRLAGLSQVQVHEKAGLTFASALRSILRQDPDKVMVGEIRDEETAQIAVQAALTGHLVFTTVHANNVVDVLGRFLNMKVELYNFVSALNCVLAQRLVRKICPHCKVVAEPSAKLLEESGLDPKEVASLTFYEGRGCIECNGTGFFGRMAITELLDLSDRIRGLILDRRPAAEIKKAAKEEGMSFLRESALRKALSGETTLKEINKVTFVD